MSKLVLNIEALDVKSFETTGTALKGRGTVDAHQAPAGPSSDPCQLIDRFISWIADCPAAAAANE